MSAILGRRRFLRLALGGAGAALVGVPARTAAASVTEGLLFGCMDFRLVDDTVRHSRSSRPRSSSCGSTGPS